MIFPNNLSSLWRTWARVMPALAVVLPGALAPLAAAQEQAAPYMTGTQLMHDLLAEPAASVGAGSRRERALGYVDGVLDAANGQQWCPSHKAPSHEIHYLVIEDLMRLAPGDLAGNAAALVTGTMASRYPCGAASSRPAASPRAATPAAKSKPRRAG